MVVYLDYLLLVHLVAASSSRFFLQLALASYAFKEGSVFYHGNTRDPSKNLLLLRRFRPFFRCFDASCAVVVNIIIIVVDC